MTARLATPADDDMASTPRIGFGEVRHRRLAPVEHAFAYPICFVLLPMRTLRAQGDAVLSHAIDARLFGFVDATTATAARGSQRSGLARRAARRAKGWTDADGEAVAALHPADVRLRVQAGELLRSRALARTARSAAIVVEVNNTFGERHCYLLAVADLAFGRTQFARKVFRTSRPARRTASTRSASCAPTSAPPARAARRCGSSCMSTARRCS